MSTYAEVVASARTILNDTETPYTWSDLDLMMYLNDAIAQASLLRPDLFEATSAFVCVEGAIQQLPATTIRLMEVFAVVGGNTITEVPRESLDRFTADWMTRTADAEAPPVNWARNPRSNRTFFLYPPATADLSILLQVATTPERVTVTSTELPVPGAYFPALVDFVVGRAEMRDDEHASDERAQQMLQSFAAAFGAALQTKSMADREDAGIQGSGKVPLNG